MDTLFGQIIETLKNPESGGDVYAVGQEKVNAKAFSKKLGIKMRDEILIAKRYHLGSDITRSAALLAFNIEDPIKDIIGKARLPFESIWIEFPTKDKLAAFGLEVSPNAREFHGALIKRINNSPSNFTITPVGKSNMAKYAGRDFVDWSPISIEVNSGTSIDINYRNSQEKYFRNPILTLVREKALPQELDENQFVKGFLKATLIGGKTELEELDKNKKLTEITDYAVHCLTPYFGKIYYDAIETLHKKDKDDSADKLQFSLRKGLGYILNEQAGIFRFIISVLALLNDKEYIKLESIKPGKSRPNSLIKPKQQAIYEYVTMTVPHNVFIMNHQNLSEAKREVMRHEVTGTWVNYHRTGKNDCEHSFANLDENGNKKICMLCGRKKTWRREHERGNIELGFKQRPSRLILGA
jgi:hypothetical protein